MQIPNARLQVSFIKDLVTLADPTNPFSFLAFLHENGRLYHFLNAQFESVSRREFSEYFSWAANKNPQIIFGEEVEQVLYDGIFVVKTNKRILKAENIAIGIGKVPYLPEIALDGQGKSQFHSADYAYRSDTLSKKRVTVIGSGQSGAEIVNDLLSRSENTAPSAISWISRRTGFWPLDDAPFTNDLFMPDHQHYFSTLEEERRRKFLKSNVLASDGISLKTLRSIYQKIYSNRFVDRRTNTTVALLPGREVVRVGKDGAAWVLNLRHKDSAMTETTHADVIIWATGYKNAPTPFLEDLQHRMEMEGEEIRVDQNFSAAWDGPPDRSIFVLNASRTQKGLADPNLSLLAWRSARIIERLTGEPLLHEPAPSMISWMAEDVSNLQREAG